VPLLEKFDEDALEIGVQEDHYVEGRFGDYVVVSVPESCNMARAEEIREKVMALVKRPVVVLSHNISLLKVTRLSSSEAAEVIRKGEAYAERIEANIKALTGGGLRSGASESGNSDTGKEPGQGESVGSEDSGNKEGEQKSDA
jgi:hypothetical protein